MLRIKDIHLTAYGCLVACHDRTVDESADLIRLRGWGCDAVVTDCPDVAGREYNR